MLVSFVDSLFSILKYHLYINITFHVLFYFFETPLIYKYFITFKNRMKREGVKFPRNMTSNAIIQERKSIILPLRKK